ncbi:phage baseplate assembly protein V [Anabaena sp. CCY 9402-a]|uniref:phage baseplate assembly protein V n=1 Tax=Anabaena sp. CCY 9402-a TaxID=3103867 RepID=UPI0039C6815E
MTLFDILLQSQKASQIAIDQQGRVPYPTLAVVVDVLDPENRRRIKVSTASNPQVQSDWIRRLTPFPQYDPPMPELGQTVLVFYADGLESNAYYLQLVNDTNPAISKGDALNDRAETIPGDDTTQVAGASTLEADSITNNCEGDFTVDSQQSIDMQALQDLTLFASRYLRLQAGINNFIELGFDGTNRISGNWTINLSGASINFTNASTITINGQSIATVGATDSDGDTIITKGW